jgi:tetratricopeptide (TPR) repeat protein
MDGRTSVWLLAVSLALGGAGCVTPQNQAKTISPAGMTPAVEEAPVVKKDDGPKHPAQARTEIEFGKFKEAEADSEFGKKDPAAQAAARDQARKAYQAALKVDPNNLDAARHLAKVYVKMGDYDRAFDAYKKALAKFPKDPELWYDLGKCHNRRKDFNASIPCFNEALKIDPENRAYLKELGFTLAYRGQIDQGLAVLTRAQGSALAHFNIARVLLQRDQTGQAQLHLQIALRENSDLEDARQLLASIENPNAPRAAVQ